jgi:hypothetical protein
MSFKPADVKVPKDRELMPLDLKRLQHAQQELRDAEGNFKVIRIRYYRTIAEYAKVYTDGAIGRALGLGRQRVNQLKRLGANEDA